MAEYSFGMRVGSYAPEEKARLNPIPSKELFSQGFAVPVYDCWREYGTMRHFDDHYRIRTEDCKTFEYGGWPVMRLEDVKAVAIKK